MLARKDRVQLERDVSTGLALPSETGHLPRREEGLPTFILEKLVPGGIAEVSSWQGRASEGKGTSGCGPGSSLGADPTTLWLLHENIVIIKQALYLLRPCRLGT